MAGSTGVVLAALFANGAIALLKFGGFLLTGSPSMLSETLHSVSDTGNQLFLLLGIRYSRKEASRGHPFGYGKAQFFYAFLVSVLLFGIAGWESLKHGYEALSHAGHAEAGTFTLPVVGATVETFWLNVAILTGAILFESYAFLKARRELREQMETFGWSGLRESFRRTSDMTTLTAFTEDAIALGGAAIASDPAVVHVDMFRSVFFGPQRVLVTADVSFDPTLATGDIDERIAAIEAELGERDSRVERVYIEPEL